MEGKLRQTLSRLSEDLQNLTTLDLTECKWPIRRRVLLALFERSPSLRDFNEELVHMMDEREEEISRQRAQNLAREERKESEMYFRAQMVRVVCNGLESIRWPPALEAFADPLVDLMNDKKTFLDAVAYILQVGGIEDPTYHQGRPSTPKSRPSSSSRPQNQPHTPSDRPKPSWDTSPVSHEFPEAPIPSKRVGTKQNKKGEQGMESPSGWGSLEVSTISGATSASGLGRMTGRLASPPSRVDTSGASNVDEHQQQYPKLGGEATGVARDMASLREALEGLQAQNTSLSRQLKQAHEVSARRERAERSLEVIIAELVRAVGSIVSIGGRGQEKPSSSASIGTEVAPYLAEPVTDASFVTDEEDDKFRREVEREEKEEADKLRDKRGTRVGGRSMSRYSVTHEKRRDSDMSLSISSNDASKLDSSSRKASIPLASKKEVTSNLLFRQVHEQLVGLQAQWTEAVRDARSSFMEPVRLLREASKEYLAKHPSESRGVSRGPGAVRTHTVLGIRRPQSFPYETLEEVGMDSLDVSCRADDGMWLDVNRVQQLQTDLLSFAEEASAFAKALSVPKHVKLQSEKGSRGPKRIPKSVFGPSDESRKEQEELASSASSRRDKKPKWRGPMHEKDGLDSDSSSSLSSYEGTVERSRSSEVGQVETSGKMADVLPVSIEDAQRVHYMHQLQEKASQLVLHLAALAPLAPLALHAPNSSSTTGLDCLINEINGLLDANTAIGRHISKRSARVILEAGDRARAETHALVRVLDDKTAENDAWRKLALSMTPLLSTFGKNASGILHAGWTDVSEALSGVNTLLADLQAAEKSKVNLTAQFNSNDRASHHTSDISAYSAEANNSVSTAVGGRGSGRRVNPLDALQEGFMGDEVAKLIVSLRQQSKGLGELQMKLLAAKRNLHHDAVREISALRTAKERLRAKVHSEVALESDKRKREAKRNSCELEEVVFASNHRGSSAGSKNSGGRSTGNIPLGDRPPFEV